MSASAGATAAAPTHLPALAQRVEQDGFAIVPDVFDASETAEMLRDAVAELGAAGTVARDLGDPAVRRASLGCGHNGRVTSPADEAASDLYSNKQGCGLPKNSVAGVRNILRAVPSIARLAGSARMRTLATSVLGADAFAVRGLFFDKTPGANWKVAWHQDLTIAVRERRDDVPGFGPWSRKAGIEHVQPPVEILRGMLALRFHLDDCDEENGALKVIPGSHAGGRLDAAAIEETVRQHRVITCAVAAGGVLVMRPLLLHASSSAQKPRHRRVIHIEYAATPLPGGLEWFDRVAA